jgi:hypothetical protein
MRKQSPAPVQTEFRRQVADLPLEQVLMHAEFLGVLRADAPELRQRLVPDPAGDCPDLDRLIDLALAAGAGAPPPYEVCARATRALSGPIGELQRRIAETDRVPARICALLRADPGSCPTVVGHIEPLLLAYLRAAGPRARAFFADGRQDELSLLLLRFAHFAGTQSLLRQLLADFADVFAGGFFVVAERLSELMDAFPADASTEPQIVGLLCVLLDVFSDKGFIQSAELREFDWFTLLVRLMDVVFAPWREKRDGAVTFLRIGTQMLSRFVDCLEQSAPPPLDGILGYVREYSERMYPPDLDVKHFMESKDPADAAHLQVLIDVFPMLWPAGINLMVPLFFCDPPDSPENEWAVTSEFRQAMLKRLCAMAETDFHAFGRWFLRNNVIRYFLSAKKVAPTRDRGIVEVPRVPEVWELAQLLIEKNVYREDGKPLLRPPLGEEELWDDTTRVMVENLTVIEQMKVHARGGDEKGWLAIVSVPT